MKDDKDKLRNDDIKLKIQRRADAEVEIREAVLGQRKLHADPSVAAKMEAAIQTRLLRDELGDLNLLIRTAQRDAFALSRRMAERQVAIAGMPGKRVAMIPGEPDAS